ncbi:MAG: efflux RND transporter periplasmic adaptor subunit [Bacteroidota bacterium]
MKRFRNFLYIGVGVVVVFGVGYYFLGNTQAPEEQAMSGQVQRIVNVTRGNLNLAVSANGIVQPINRVEIKSKASGQIEQLNFEEGQFVAKGALLIALDQRTAKNDYEQAKADLELQRANLQQAENNFKRAEELFAKNLISQQERDQSHVDYVRAQSQLIKAEATLSSADERLRDTRVVAPISGIILTKDVESGQIISSGVSNVGGGTVLATLADMNEVYVETNVDEVDIGKVKVGQRAKVIADAYPDESFWGEAIRIAPLGKTQQNVTTFNVIVLVKNIGGRLKAGMSASVDLEIFNRQNVLLIPNEALKDPRSEEGRAVLASFNEPEEQSKDAMTDTGKNVKRSESGGSTDLAALRERLQKMTPEERMQEFQKLRERMEKMSPEERERMRSQMRQQGGTSTQQLRGGGEGTGGAGLFFMDQGQGQRQRRQAQVGSTDEIKDRVVMVRQGTEFVPRMIKVGASNFDNAEVISGLQENDEIQITTISRAKLASQQFTERMRTANNPLGGGSAPTGGRR